MRVERVTKKQMIARAINRYCTRMSAIGRDCGDLRNKAKSLIELDDTREMQRQVDIIIGAPEWARLECDLCRVDVDEITVLTKHGDDDEIRLCTPCLIKLSNR